MERNDTENENWGIQATGPALAAHEVEEATDQLEVVVLWGAQALHVAHIDPNGEFHIGDSAEGPVAFQMGAETLGATRTALVEGGFLRVPHGAEGSVFVNGESRPLADCALTRGVEARVEIGEFAFVVRNVRAGKRIADRDVGLERRPFVYVGGVMAIAGAMLALFSLLPPSGAALTLNEIDRSSRLTSFVLESEALEQQQEELFTETGSNSEAGEAHAGDEGAMGDEAAPNQDNRYAIQGDRPREEQQMSREAQMEQAQTAGILGTLASMNNAFNGPTSPFGADMAIGSDPLAALGHLTGANVGDSFGLGGLGIIGTGRGGGANGHGTVGVGNWGGIGRTGTCTGENCGTGDYGSGVGQFTGDRVSREPRMRPGRSTIQGALSRETIRRVVRRHHNEVKFCYERALQNRPDLEGRVTARFMISPTGAVSVANVQSSSLGNSEAEQCVVSAVRRFTFPQPENGGMVSVSYPFVFSSR